MTWRKLLQQKLRAKKRTREGRFSDAARRLLRCGSIFGAMDFPEISERFAAE
jgi:hypothetical protein